MSNFTTSDQFLLYENPEYYYYITVSVAGIFVSTLCLTYILKKLLLHWIIQAILIAMSVHEILGFGLVFLGVILSYDQTFISCAMIFIPYRTIHGTVPFLSSLMSTIRYYMAWKSQKNLALNEKNIAQIAVLALLGHYVIISCIMYLALGTEGSVNLITICDGTANLALGYSLNSVIITSYYVFVISLGTIAEMAMIAFLRNRNKSSEAMPAQLVPWKTGILQTNHQVPINATILSLVVLTITIALSMLGLSFLQAQRFLWNLWLALHAGNMCFLPLILHLTVKNGRKPHPSPPQDLQFHEDSETAIAAVENDIRKKENLDTSQNDEEEPIRCISVQLQQRTVRWSSSVGSI